MSASGSKIDFKWREWFFIGFLACFFLLNQIIDFHSNQVIYLAFISIWIPWEVVTTFLDIKKVTRSFEAEFPYALESNKKIKYPFQKTLLVFVSWPLLNRWVLGFLLLLGGGSFSLIVFYFVKYGWNQPIPLLSALIVGAVLEGVFFIGFPLLAIFVRNDFLKKNGISLTPNNLINLEYKSFL